MIKDDEDINLKSLKLIKGIWSSLRKRRKKQILALFILIFVSGGAEIITFSLVVPFLSIIQSPELAYDIYIVNLISKTFGIVEVNQLLFFMTLAFVFAVLFATLIRLINLWSSNKISAGIASELSQKAYHNSLMESYETHVQRNSAELLSTSTVHINATVQVINNTLQMFAAAIISFSIVGTLFYINAIMAFWSSFIVFGCYLFISIVLKPRLQNNSKIIANYLGLQLKLIQEGLGSIRDIILDGSQEFYIKEYRKFDLRLRRLQAQSRFILNFPRIGIEGVGLIMITILGYIYINSSSDKDIIVIIGVFALGAQRLLPCIQKIYSSWASIKSYSSEIIKVLELVQIKSKEQNFKKIGKLNFEEKIQFKNVNFKYLNGPDNVLDNFNLTILKGETVGIFGPSGSGKSTFVDLLMGLLQPKSGEIIIDNINIYGDPTNQYYQSWRSCVAHVPQEIFLSDSSIAENIALSIPHKEINYKKVYESAKKAQISDFIETLPKGYSTIIGERGIFLSGGQRQRIGIARALYKEAKVLVLDEATSALDQIIEASVMKNIRKLEDEMTIIIIAHRLSTLKNCSKLIEISNKKVKVSKKNF